MQQPVTQLLAQWRNGDERAFAQLSAIMYEELRQLAQRHLRRRPRQTDAQAHCGQNQAESEKRGQLRQLRPSPGCDHDTLCKRPHAG